MTVGGLYELTDEAIMITATPGANTLVLKEAPGVSSQAASSQEEPRQAEASPEPQMTASPVPDRSRPA
eukprot:7806585-Karenia_brevis.AAC.1